MTDYSHLFVPSLAQFLGEVDRGEQLTDDAFSEALQLMHPPLLAVEAMTALLNELDSSRRRRRGRPRRGETSRVELAAAIEGLSPLPEQIAFRKALVLRLRSGNRFTELDRGLRCQKGLDSMQRNSLLRGLYRDFYRLVGSEPYVDHDIIGRIETPPEYQSCSCGERARVLTQIAMRDVFGLSPPSVEAMRNLVRIKFTDKK